MGLGSDIRVSRAPMLGFMAMGASGTYIGRAFVYGLGAMGEEGVTRALECIHKELDSSMGLCGRTDVGKLDRDILMIPKGFAGDWE